MPPWMLIIEAAVVDMSAGIREFTRRAVRLVFVWREGRGEGGWQAMSSMSMAKFHCSHRLKEP